MTQQMGPSKHGSMNADSVLSKGPQPRLPAPQTREFFMKRRQNEIKSKLAFPEGNDREICGLMFEFVIF